MQLDALTGSKFWWGCFLWRKISVTPKDSCSISAKYLHFKKEKGENSHHFYLFTLWFVSILSVLPFVLCNKTCIFLYVYLNLLGDITWISSYPTWALFSGREICMFLSKLSDERGQIQSFGKIVSLFGWTEVTVICNSAMTLSDFCRRFQL